MTQLLIEYGARCDIVDDSGNSAETILQSLVTRYGNGPNLELVGLYQQLLRLFWESHGELKPSFTGLLSSRGFHGYLGDLFLSGISTVTKMSY